MKYMLLIYSREADWAAMSHEERNRMFGEYFAYTDAIKGSGNYITGAPLQPTATATMVRVKDGRTLTTDGPYAETREQLGGFYLVDAKDLDEAIALAARIPGARVGGIEVRPVLEASASQDSAQAAATGR